LRSLLLTLIILTIPISIISMQQHTIFESDDFITNPNIFRIIDFDNDSDDDYLVGSRYPNTGIFFVENIGNGEYLHHEIHDNGMNTEYIEAVDCNQDGDFELAIMYPNQVDILEKNEADEFQVAASFHNLAFTPQLDYLDIDLDGEMDLLFQKSDHCLYKIIWEDNSYNLELVEEFSICLENYKFKDLDLDGDHDMMHITHITAPNSLNFWENNDDQFILNQTIPLGDEWARDVNALLNLDEDSLPDLACNVDGNIRLYKNLGNINFETTPVILADYDFVGVSNIDGDSDVEFYSSNPSRGYVYELNVENFELNSVELLTAHIYNISDVQFKDYNDDGVEEIVLLSFLSECLIYLTKTGLGGNCSETYIFEKPVNKPRYIEVGDLDSDSDLDIVIESSGDNKLSIFRNLGELNFEHIILDDFLNRPSGVEILDIDGDDDNDLLVLTNYYMLYLFLNNGEGNFTKTVFKQFDEWLNSMDTADYDNDGDMDLVIGVIDNILITI